MRDKKHVVVNREGKEVEYHVNRVWKHEPWNNMHLDGKLPPVPLITSKEHESKEGGKLEVGEIIVYPKHLEEPD